MTNRYVHVENPLGDVANGKVRFILIKTRTVPDLRDKGTLRRRGENGLNYAKTVKMEARRKKFHLHTPMYSNWPVRAEENAR